MDHQLSNLLYYAFILLNMGRRHFRQVVTKIVKRMNSRRSPRLDPSKSAPRKRPSITNHPNFILEKESSGPFQNNPKPSDYDEIYAAKILYESLLDTFPQGIVIFNK